MKKFERRELLHNVLQSWTFWTYAPDGSPRIEVLHCIKGLMEYCQYTKVVSREEREQLSELATRFQKKEIQAYSFRDNFLDRIHNMFSEDLRKARERSSK